MPRSTSATDAVPTRRSEAEHVLRAHQGVRIVGYFAVCAVAVCAPSDRHVLFLRHSVSCPKSRTVTMRCTWKSDRILGLCRVGQVAVFGVVRDLDEVLSVTIGRNILMYLEHRIF